MHRSHPHGPGFPSPGGTSGVQAKPLAIRTPSPFPADDPPDPRPESSRKPTREEHGTHADPANTVAPDLVGFGRSDKPAEIADHTYARHIAWTRSLVLDALGLRDITLVCQDWGALIGLRLVTAHPDAFARVVAANAALPTGDFPMPETWLRFRQSVRTAPSFDIPRAIQSGCTTTLTDAVRAAYDAPFPDETFKAAARAMPGLVSADPDDVEAQPNRDAWDILKTWTKPFLVAFSDSDPITGPMAPVFRALVPGAQGRTHPTLRGAGHFLQEDAGARLGREIVQFVGRNTE